MQRSSQSASSTVFFILRSSCSAIGAWIGASGANVLVQREFLAGTINIIYLAIAGFLMGYLIGGPVATYGDKLWTTITSRLAKIPPQAVLAAGIGAMVALVITVLLNSLLERIPGFNWYWSLLITLPLVIGSAWFFVVNRHMFNLLQANPALLKQNGELPVVLPPKIIDTSAIIDGRIVDIVEACFIDGRILVPQVVLAELQNIADSHDPLRRKRGRRGLEMLDKLVQQRITKTEVLNHSDADISQTDDQLIKLCQKHNADLITTDYNLNRVAALQGIKVLNVNQLSNAVKVMFLPGEHLSLHIVREGREPGQGLAYLEDGTMVVVEDTAHLAGTTVDAVVTSNLQTNMGRMIFARLINERNEERG